MTKKDLSWLKKDTQNSLPLCIVGVKVYFLRIMSMLLVMVVFYARMEKSEKDKFGIVIIQKQENF